MRVLVLTDTLFASRERSLLSRLEVGLADEGVRVVHAVPRSAGRGSETESLFMRTVHFPEHGLPWTLGWRASRMLDDIEQIESFGPEDGIDIVHVFGGSMWGLGAELARQSEAALAIEVWRSGQIPRARALKAKGRHPVFMAPDAGIERALLAEGPGLTVRLTPWGLHTPSLVKPRLEGDHVPGVMLVGTGLDAPAFAAAMQGLAEAANGREVLLFIDALAARRCDAWSLAKKFDLWSSLSLIDELESRRDLLIQGDILLLPEGQGEQRSIVLEAMACGMVVVAAEDPYCTHLKQGETALLVQQGDARGFARVLGSLLEGTPEAAASVRRIAESARVFVRDNRKASEHVRHVLAAYTWMSAPKPLPFERGV